jgi:hypothetical protein
MRIPTAASCIGSGREKVQPLFREHDSADLVLTQIEGVELIYVIPPKWVDFN